jgi:glycosyltransferase involved in cell wall biosynthesis
MAESQRLRTADGIMYAALAHENLLHQARYTGASCRLPSGCPLPESAPASDKPLFDLGYVGSLAPENGLETLLISLAECPGLSLCLIGGGSQEYRSRLDGLVARLNLEERVTFLGVVPFGDIRSRMRQCQLGVVPISARCGPEKRQYASPLKLMEWMAAGVPVIASAVPSITQQVRHGQQAWLTPPDNKATLVAAISRLMNDKPLRQSLARAGLDMATEITYAQRARRITSFIRDVPGHA